MALDGLLRNKLVKYKNAELCRQDCARALHRYNKLTPDLQKFIHNDGRETELLALDGTLPVVIRGVTYNIPVCVWLQENHPYVHPLVFVKPTSSMAIKPSHHVDTYGKVYLPFLHEWAYPKSDLAALLQILCCVFADNPPVYSKAAQPQQPPAAYRPPPGGYPHQYGSYPPNPAGSTPYQVGGHSRMPMPMPMPAFRIALIQLAVSSNKSQNLLRAKEKIKAAVSNGAKVVALPECFNSPYGTQYFVDYAEEIPGESTNMLSSVAKETQCYVIGGSIPERDSGKLYNTSTSFGPDGAMLAKHRKVHLFDIDVPGKIRFQESEVLSPGSQLTMIETSLCKIGIGICYDMRFPEMAQVYTQEGCKLLLYPGAFNMTTGPAHWEPLIRSRALDNQLYVAAVSPARDEKASYVAWGHSTVISPWGDVVAKADHTEQILYSEIDLNYLEQIRAQVPVQKQKRNDLYKLQVAS